jgi:hypothetical protein
VPVCIICGGLLSECKCEKQGGKHVMYATSDGPLSRAQRENNFQKWVEKMKLLKSEFPAQNFKRYCIFFKKYIYKINFNSRDMIGDEILDLVIKYEDDLKGLMAIYADSKDGKRWQKDVFKGISTPEFIAFCAVAVSKFVDFDFAGIFTSYIFIIEYNNTFVIFVFSALYFLFSFNFFFLFPH